MTFITWACLRCVQELATILGPQNPTQRAWWPSWCCFEIDFQNCWWPESHEIAYWKINGYLAGDGNEQQDGLSAIRGLLLKNWRYTATSVQGSTRTSEHFSTRMQIFLELTRQSSCEGAEDGLSKQHSFWRMVLFSSSMRHVRSTGYSQHLQEEEPSQSLWVLLQNDWLGSISAL